VSSIGDDDVVVCRGCGRRGSLAEVALSWSFDIPPRPTGSAEAPSTAEAAYLCPECTRRVVRDVEARLDV